MIVIILLLVLVSLIFYHFYVPKEKFINETLKNGRKDNPLYASPDKESSVYVHHIHPAGDKNSMEVAGVGKGTSGGFLPLQGNGAQLFMSNSTSDNKMTHTNKIGKVGGYPNYTNADHDTVRTDGVQDFGLSGKEYQNTHMIDGANKRVSGHGTKGSLKCSDFWPKHDKDSRNFCVTSNDDIYNKNFSKNKMQTRWEKVLN